MQKEIDTISQAAGRLLQAFLQSIRQFEAETRESRNELFQEWRKSGRCCGQEGARRATSAKGAGRRKA